MKTVYIPKGHTVCYESLETEHLVVEGCLKTTYGVKAKTITGGGVLSTGTTSADVICLDELETGSVFCRRLLARRVQTPKLFASDSATVSCFLSAAYVETGKLTVAISETDEVKADEVIHLKPKKRGMLATLLLSALRSFWIGLTARNGWYEPMDADYMPAESVPEAAGQSGAVPEVNADTAHTPETDAKPEAGETPEAEDEPDEELNRVIGLFKLARESGYTLRLIPGTPEENAPVFNFQEQRVIPPAA